jgi:para-nitrobenzyl esterase
MEAGGSGPITMIEPGHVSGRRTAWGIEFLGIPYATAALREAGFAPPGPVRPWKGTRACTELSPVCPQIETYGPVGSGALSALRQDEACLRLNVRTPSLDGRRPVLVWLHGGGLALGSGGEPYLTRGAFAQSGVVEVTINYRLGLVGFMPVADATAPANRGLLDQIAALQWVHRNIAAFGGDPARVTIGGRSGGGFSVAGLLASPAARGLFHRAVLNSGFGNAYLLWDEAERVAQLVAGHLGLAAPTARTLANVPITALLEAQKLLCDDCYTHHDYGMFGAAAILGLPFQMVVDGGVLPAPPAMAVAQGSAAGIPLMITTTSQEALTHTSIYKDLDWEAYDRVVSERVRQPFGDPAEVRAYYRHCAGDRDPRGALTILIGDLMFQLAGCRLAFAQAPHAAVYKAVFDGSGSARHGDDAGYVWWSRRVNDPGVPPRHRVADPDLANEVHGAVVSFIGTGTPVISGGPDWPLYGRENPAVMSWSTGGCSVVTDPFVERLPLMSRDRFSGVEPPG